MRARGAEVEGFEHRPRHAHDWLSGSGGWETRRAVREYAPDVLVTADYPYAFLREVAPKALLVGTRHSLAARGNTWEREHQEADRVVTWGAWDEGEFERRAVNICPLRAGCVWLNPLSWRGGGGILWMPTWNPGFRDEVRVMEALPAGVRGVLRAHAATVWREPDFLEEARRRGWEIAEEGSPWRALSEADLVVTDVSGSVFLAGAAGVPRVVQMDPLIRAGAQYDPTGPEWKFRAGLGEVVAPFTSAASLRLVWERLLGEEADGQKENREGIVSRMVEGYGGEAAARVVAALEAA